MITARSCGHIVPKKSRDAPVTLSESPIFKPNTEIFSVRVTRYIFNTAAVGEEKSRPKIRASVESFIADSVRLLKVRESVRQSA